MSFDTRRQLSRRRLIDADILRIFFDAADAPMIDAARHIRHATVIFIAFAIYLFSSPPCRFDAPPCRQPPPPFSPFAAKQLSPFRRFSVATPIFAELTRFSLSVFIFLSRRPITLKRPDDAPLRQPFRCRELRPDAPL